MPSHVTGGDMTARWNLIYKGADDSPLPIKMWAEHLDHSAPFQTMRSPCQEYGCCLLRTGRVASLEGEGVGTPMMMLYWVAYAPWPRP